jgi:CHAT domain-containing protein
LHYLINDYNISYDYSATLWKENQNAVKHNNNSKMIACAAAYPSVDSTLLGIRLPYYFNLRKSLKSLPAAQKEIAALSQNFEGNFLWNDSTNENYFKKNAENYGIIHLAMHGILEKKSPMLSSLAFTDNKDSLEDNFLQAYEISNLKLNADLVVLSACETGYGKFEQGEGVISLARSFMYAGASSLVVSLWQVNDASTSSIMIGYYSNLTNGIQKAEALRKAKLSYLENASGIYAHPAFWSPFIQLGNTKPIKLQRKKNLTIWIIPSVVLLLSLGFFIYRRQKKHAD